MLKTKVAGLVLLGVCASQAAFANGLQEDRPWQFEDANRKYLHLNEILAQEKMKEGGFKQVFNVSADGASAIYVGNNTSYGDVDSISNNTSIGNMNNVDITGDDNVVKTGQDNNGSAQVAAGSKIGKGDVEIGAPLIP